MTFQITKAKREKVYLKIAMTGASGFGKTYSALKLARGMTDSWDKICVIDTENNSANLYSDLGPFNHIDFQPPYSPKRYIEVIKFAYESKPEVIIIDSASHEWDGPGGCLEIHGNLGGQFAHWKTVTPLHKAFIDAILQTPCHIISNLRTKSDYSIDKDERTGKAKIEKVGLKATQREGFDYEVSIEFRISQNHMAVAAKDRTGLFSGDVPFLIDEKTGEKLKKWNEAAPAAPEKKTYQIYEATDEQKRGLVAMLKAKKIGQERWAPISGSLTGHEYSDANIELAIKEAGL